MAFQPQAAPDQGLSIGTTAPTLGTTKQVAVFDPNQITAKTLTAHGMRLDSETETETFITTPATVRRLTPRECERLQGFPDDYTLAMGADARRYRALGNSMAIPVIRWIGERILEVEAQ